MGKTVFAFVLVSVLLPAAGSAQLTDQLYTDACDEGDLVSCNVYGLMLEHGEGVARDPDRALEEYRKACEGGLLVGCTNLGLLYGTGVGVEQDLERARGSYEIACEGGDPLGCDLFALLDSAGTPDDQRYTKTGQVGDQGSGVVLSNALVELADLGRRAVTDQEGRITFEDLPRGEYRLRVEALGYVPLDGTLSVPGREQFAVLLEQADVADPDAPGGIAGRVVDDHGNAISDVDIVVTGRAGSRGLSNRQGRFALTDVAPGLLEVHFTRLGYAPRTAFLVVQPGRTVDLDVEMPTAAIEIAPIEVTVRSQFLEREGFYKRGALGWGQTWDRKQIESLAPVYVSDIVRRANGVFVQRLPGGVDTYLQAINLRVSTPDRGLCALAVYVDGIRTGTFNLNQVDLGDIEAMEVYTGGNGPIEYQLMNPCSVVLIWTHR